MENTIQYTFHIRGEAQEILLAQLSMTGFEGFEQFPDRLIACIQEPALEAADLQFVIDQQIPYERIVLEPRNWNAEWESSFQPVIIEDFCVVRANFHQPVPGVQYDIQVTPKMSFGTGHHATTYQMIQLMRSLPLKDRQVLDFGTGTGVLAILAEKMGAAHIEAIDNDVWSIENAGENIAANDCVHITLAMADKIRDDQKYEVILANINKHVILHHMQSIKDHLVEEGVVLFSGLLANDREDIVKAAVNVGMTLEESSTRDNWLALKMRG